MGRPRKEPVVPESETTTTNDENTMSETTETELPKGAEKILNEAKEGRKGLTPQQKGIAKILAGLGLTGAILYFSPYTLAELASLLAIPLLIVLIVMGLLTGVSVSGNGLMEAIGKPEFWSGIQSKLEAKAKELRARE